MNEQTPRSAPAAIYPLIRSDEDPRFTLGLLADVAKVLTAHGYPPLRAGADLLRVSRALFTALYQPDPASHPDQTRRPETSP